MIKDWGDSETAAILKLSAKQIEAIDQAFLVHQLRLMHLRAEVVKLIVHPAAWVSATAGDEAPEPNDPLVALRVTVEQEQARMVAVLQGILTTEQWRTLRQLQPHRTPRSLVITEPAADLADPAASPHPQE